MSKRMSIATIRVNHRLREDVGETLVALKGAAPPGRRGRRDDLVQGGSLPGRESA